MRRAWPFSLMSFGRFCATAQGSSPTELPDLGCSCAGRAQLPAQLLCRGWRAVPITLSPSHCPHPQVAPSLTHKECTSASLQRAVVLLSVIVIPVCDQKCFKTIFIVSSANSSLLAPYHNTNMTKVTTAKKITGADNYSLFGFVLFLSSVNGDSGYTKEQTCESKLPDSYQEDLVLSMCT